MENKKYINEKRIILISIILASIFTLLFLIRNKPLNTTNYDKDYAYLENILTNVSANRKLDFYQVPDDVNYELRSQNGSNTLKLSLNRQDNGYFSFINNEITAEMSEDFKVVRIQRAYDSEKELLMAMRYDFFLECAIIFTGTALICMMISFVFIFIKLAIKK